MAGPSPRRIRNDCGVAHGRAKAYPSLLLRHAEELGVVNRLGALFELRHSFLRLLRTQLLLDLRLHLLEAPGRFALEFDDVIPELAFHGLADLARRQLERDFVE